MCQHRQCHVALFCSSPRLFISQHIYHKSARRFIYSFIYGLFNDTSNSRLQLAASDMLKKVNEFGRLSKAAVTAECEVLTQTCTERLRKTTEDFVRIVCFEGEIYIQGRQNSK